MLDYPAVFSKEDVFALRTLFWWGKFLSVSLQLAGKYKTLLAKNAAESIRQNGDAGLFLCIHEDQWHHHFEQDNYRQATVVDFDDVMEKPFFKIALKYELQDWNNLPSLIPQGYATLAGFLK